MKKRPAITFKGEHISYATLAKSACARWHTIKDITPKRDFLKVAICAPNSPQWIYTMLGAWKTDGVVLPLDHMASKDELSYILQEAKPEVIFCSKDRMESIKEGSEGYSPRIIDIDSPFDGIRGPVKFDFHRKLSKKNHNNALLIYTSGTTGGPKGVLLSFANLFANIDAVCNRTKIFSKDKTVLALLPFHHIFPIMGCIIAPLYVGTTIAMTHSLDPLEIINVMKENRVAMILGVPRFYTRIFNGIKSKIDKSLATRTLFSLCEMVSWRPFSKLVFGSVQRKFGGKVKYLVSGGAALDQKIAQGLETLGFKVLEGYGMTEAAPMITFPRPNRVRLGTVGEALFGVNIKTEAGEVLVKGPNIMKGYYRKEKETSETIINGWLHTGDLGELDEAGYLTIKGRSKELIILPNGKNINPLEVEEKLMKIASQSQLSFQELAVGQKGDGLHLFFVTNDCDNRSHVWQSILSPYNDAVPSYKQIQSFQLLKTPLPKTRLEKIKRHELNTLIEKRVIDQKVERFSELNTIEDYLTHELEDSIHLHSSFFGEIALDSMGQVGLFSLIQEKFGHTVDIELLNQYDTPYKLACFLRDTKPNTQEEIELPKTSPSGLFLKTSISIVLRTYLRIKKSGEIPRGRQIFVCNHQSYLDAPLLSIFFRNSFIKKTFFFAKAKHFNNRILRFFAATHNIVVFDKNSNLSHSLKQLGKLLEQGKNIVIFPEGTRSFDGALGEFKNSFAILAKKYNIPITPVAISGAFKVMPRGAIIPRPLKEVSINFLEQVIPVAGEDYDQISEKVFHMIDKKLSTSPL